MTNEPEFTLTVTVGDESQDFALGAEAILSLMSGGMYVDRPEFAGALAAAAQHPAVSVRRAVAGRDHLPGDAAMALANDPCTSVRAELLRSAIFRRIAPESTVVALIASDPEVAMSVAELVAQFENADINVLCESLAAHPDPSVRRALVDAGGAPLKWLKKLRDDPAPDVAERALFQLVSRSGGGR